MTKGARGKGSGRDPGAFVAIPYSVLDSKAYIGLSYPAKALLLELARQYRGDDNGRLLLERKKLAARGWTSPEVIQRARDQLIGAGLVHETVKGRRPNKASWYAITWYTLDKLEGFDPGTALTFSRGAYREFTSPKRQIPSTPPVQERAPIGTAPVQGEPAASTPPVPIRAQMDPSPCTPAVHPLEKPSPGVLSLPSSSSEFNNDPVPKQMGSSGIKTLLEIALESAARARGAEA